MDEKSTSELGIINQFDELVRRLFQVVPGSFSDPRYYYFTEPGYSLMYFRLYIEEKERELKEKAERAKIEKIIENYLIEREKPIEPNS